MKNHKDVNEQFELHGKTYRYISLENTHNLHSDVPIKRIPYSVRTLFTSKLMDYNFETYGEWIAGYLNKYNDSLSFYPSRVLLQDFTGIPLILDFLSIKNYYQKQTLSKSIIEPMIPIDLVMDHSVIVNKAGDENALRINSYQEFKQNEERYKFVKGAEKELKNLRVYPPSSGIMHQLNLEYLSKIVDTKRTGKDIYDISVETLIGTDSHTTMVNALGILGWGVGGIEALSVILGQEVNFKIPEVVGVTLTGNLNSQVSSSELTFHIVSELRKKNVTGKFVEFIGPSLKNLTLADRATISNMAPEYGALIGFFPVDKNTLDYMQMTGRNYEHIELVEKYFKLQSLFYSDSYYPNYDDVLNIDLGNIKPSIAGPNRPDINVELKHVKRNFMTNHLNNHASQSKSKHKIKDGAVVIASITSCTTTSNPYLMITAGLVAKKAVELGISPKSYVKTSFNPGSRVVEEYLRKSNLLTSLNKLGFNISSFGCAVCNGNGGPLSEDISSIIKSENIETVSITSGNRNFQGRIHPDVKYNYLCSPALVIAYSITGSILIDFENEPIYSDNNKTVFLKDIWPTPKEIDHVMRTALDPRLFVNKYKTIKEHNPQWNKLKIESLDSFFKDSNSTYIKLPDYFNNQSIKSNKIELQNARCLLVLGDNITTDDISPVGSIEVDSDAALYLKEHGVQKESFNSYGSRRGNHEVMIRGAFSNKYLNNELLKGRNGGHTIHMPSKSVGSVYNIAMKYREDNVPLVIIAGERYGIGSSRDWAAKVPYFLGVKAILAKSFENIHRRNLIFMGILPVEIPSSTNLQLFNSPNILLNMKSWSNTFSTNQEVLISINNNGQITDIKGNIRLDTENELDIYSKGGIIKKLSNDKALDFIIQ